MSNDDALKQSIRDTLTAMNMERKMSDSLMKLGKSMELSSLKQAARDAESVMLLIDTSGSMANPLVNGDRRIDGLRKVVADIKTQGHVPMIAFGGPYDAQVRFVDDVPEPAGGTPLHAAIPLAKTYGATRLVVVSDGEPDLADQSMIEAKAFGGRIDVVFVGDKGGPGSFFLDKLAASTGGVRMEGDLSEVKRIGKAIIGLLEGEVEAKPVITGNGFAVVDEPAAGTDDDSADFEEDEDEDDDE